jgi:DNA-binding YbaB/EbfC family protein
MFGNLGEIAGLMKKAKDIQSNLKKTKDEMASAEYSGSSGGGMVEVLVSGDMNVKRVVINPQCVSDVDVLEDLVTAAMNDALNKAKLEAQAKMQEITGGIKIPGLF